MHFFVFPTSGLAIVALTAVPGPRMSELELVFEEGGPWVTDSLHRSRDVGPGLRIHGPTRMERIFRNCGVDILELWSRYSVGNSRESVTTREIRYFRAGPGYFDGKRALDCAGFRAKYSEPARFWRVRPLAMKAFFASGPWKQHPGPSMVPVALL